MSQVTADGNVNKVGMDSTQLGIRSPLTEQHSLRFRVFDVYSIQISKDAVIIRSNRTGNVTILTLYEAKLLFSCQEFSTLKEHAKRFYYILNKTQRNKETSFLGKLLHIILYYTVHYDLGFPIMSGEMALILQKLNAFVENGFLISELELQKEIKLIVNQNIRSESKLNMISVIGIPTCDRPKSFKRCIESYINNFIQYDRMPHIIIIDDSRSINNIKQNKRLLYNVKDKYPGEIYYLDRKARTEYALMLSQKININPDIIYFALMGELKNKRTVGGCRNTLLLLTRDQITVQTDDDTICQVAQPPTIHSSLELTSKPSPYEFWFFKTFDDASELVNFQDINFLEIHERMIGKHLPDVVASFEEKGNYLKTDSLSSSFLSKLNMDNPRIRLTQLGPIGDSCLLNNLYRLFLEANSLQRLLYPKEEYPNNLITRLVIRSVTHSTISDFNNCIGMNIALDNRVLLPPFMPIGWNQDGIFGSLLNSCFSNSFIGHLPFVIPHLPPNVKAQSYQSVYASLVTIRSNDLLMEVIQSKKSWSSGKDPMENLFKLGLYIKELGGLSRHDFIESLRYIYVNLIRQRIQQAEQSLETHTLEDYWANEVFKYIKTLQKGVMNSNYFLKQEKSFIEMESFQKTMSRFGDLLIEWPKIVQVSDGLESIMPL